VRARDRVLVVVAVALPVLALGRVEPAQAHPLGNFSISTFSGLEVFSDRVVVHHVVDMAEIPTLKEMRSIDADRDGTVSSAELQGYADDTARALKANLSVEVEGAVAALDVAEARASLRSGQGGLEVLRVASLYTADLSQSEATVRFRDDNFSDRLGWHEVVAYGSGGQGIAASSVPSESVTNGLRDYPRERLASPLDVTGATVEVAPGATPGGHRGGPAPEAGPVDPFSSAFASLIEHDLSFGFLAFALLTAMGAGALHALGPGHGKSVMTAYLIGTHGRLRHAVVVGVAISLMHTASVIALGLVTLWASRSFPSERVYPYLSLVSGTVVLCLGAWLLRTRVDQRRAVRHDHRGGHGHGYSHGGSFHHHASAPGPSDSPLSWKGIGTLALSGGLLPSPAALVVLLGAVALERVAFGLTLVGAFSIGLAGALTLLGVLVLKARGFAAERLASRPAALMPLLSAGMVCLLGLLLTTRAVIGL
jgi:nickel/cobalt transporter (NicO) family protein